MKGIYKIINIKNSKVYIGQSVDIKERRDSHFEALKSNRHYNKYLQNSFNKYGEENFKFEVIEITGNLNEREIFWIQFYNACNCEKGYNLLHGGTKFKMTPLVKAKISKGIKEFYKDNEEARQRVSEQVRGENNPFYGRKHNKETVEKIREANIGRVQSEEEKSKRRETLRRNPPNLGRKFSVQARENMSLAHLGNKPGNKKEFGSLEICEIIKMFQNGETIKKIAEKFEMSYIPIKRILIEKGVYKQKNPRKPLTDIELDEIIKRNENGESMRSISREYNLTPTGLAKKIKSRERKR